MAMLIVLFALGGWWRGAPKTPRVPPSVVVPAQTPPGKASPASAAEPAAAANREATDRLVLEIQRGLLARDPQQRETAFNFLLPNLLSQEPERAVDMVARQEPGEARDALRNEVARQWITRDSAAAIAWMKMIDSETERRESATVAVAALAAVSPGQAIRLAEEFGIGRDDGYQLRLVQIWAEGDIDAATRWIEGQPPGEHTEQLRARIEQVRMASR
jgi:hypothetical protein